MSGLNSILYYGYLGTMEESAECSHFKFTVGHFFHTLRSQKNVQRGIQQNQIKKWKCFNDMVPNQQVGLKNAKTNNHNSLNIKRKMELKKLRIDFYGPGHKRRTSMKKLNWKVWFLATHAIKLIITCLKRRTNKAREPIIVELIFLGPRAKGNHSQVIVEW